VRENYIIIDIVKIQAIHTEILVELLLLLGLQLLKHLLDLLILLPVRLRGLVEHVVLDVSVDLQLIHCRAELLHRLADLKIRHRALPAQGLSWRPAALGESGLGHGSFRLAAGSSDFV
jgi:hypothetical protein